MYPVEQTQFPHPSLLTGQADGMLAQELEVEHQEVPALKVRHLPQPSEVAQHEGTVIQVFELLQKVLPEGQIQLPQLS